MRTRTQPLARPGDRGPARYNRYWHSITVLRRRPRPPLQPATEGRPQRRPDADRGSGPDSDSEPHRDWH